nr:reverse transcriptase domain-containing protein [Tanacetum cinerariifolium]
MPHGFGSRVTWGGRVRAMVLFRWVKVYERCCGVKGKKAGKEVVGTVGAVRTLGLGQKRPLGFIRDQPKRQNSEWRSDFKSQPRDGRGSNKFTPLTRMPKEIFAAESGKFKPPPPMVTLVEKRSSNKFCEFHNDKGYITDECVQLRKHIEELKVTRSFAQVKEITFLPLAAHKGTGAPLVIEAEISGHAVHRIYVDVGSSMEVLYEHCFHRLRPEIKSQMVPATMSLTGFSGETIWLLGQLRLLVTIGDAEHYTRAWMNFMIVRSPSPYNGIIERPGIREIQAVPSKAHRMLKFQMAKQDEEKTAFHTSHGVYCYTKMPFGLKNAGATYQRLVDKALDKKVGRNLEIYVDDLVIKSHTETELLRDIEETFRTLRRINMKLNPKNTPDAKQAFKQLKQHLARLPMLVVPKPQEELIMYLSTSYGAISAILMIERDTVQTPVYFVSRALYTPKLNYTPMEKLVLTLVCGYFQAHSIVVITDQPIKHMMSRPNVVGRLQKWSIMLGEYNITYRPRTSVKGQILVDFHVEKPNDAPPEASVIETPQDLWTLFTNGSSYFTTSSNEAEYESLIVGLRIAAQMGVHNIHVSVDSKLAANQVLGTYVAKEENMVKYLAKAKNLISSFANFSISQVPRIKIKKADALSKIASTGFAHLSKQVLVEVLKEKSVQEEEVATVVEEEGPTWMTPIMEYLKDKTLPGPGKVKFLIVAMDYFTKWIEAKAVATITDGQDWCEKFNIIQRFASVKHPQSNGLVERANRSLGEGITARLGEGNKNWIEELLYVLWAHRTMIKSSHGDTPFSLTYGTEAVIPAEIEMPTYRTAVVDAVHNNEELQLNIDLLEEHRECATIREAKTKLKMTKYYNSRVRGVTFRPGDFFYRSNEASHAMDGGKLGSKWEGPYEVIEALGDETYKLRSLDGAILPRT